MKSMIISLIVLKHDNTYVFMLGLSVFFVIMASKKLQKSSTIQKN